MKAPRDYRSENLQRRYGLTIHEFNFLLKQQEGRCACCDRDGLQLFVDHNHTSGKIRGLLCNACNTGLGLFGEDVHRFRLATEYLRKHTPPATGEETE